MKPFIFFVFALFVCQFMQAQSVGIGTTSPNTKAQLDVASTTKGLLIPRMTSTDRLAIAAPVPPGLMVYETTTNSFWYYNGSVWNQIGTGGLSPWTVSGNTIYNSNTGNVGIGTSSPTSKLHIAGNSLLINGTNPILQYQQGGVNTGYVQVSGDDLRMGTNSGNGSGKLVIRMDGTDRVYVDSIGQIGIKRSAPAYDLDINGNTRIHSTSSAAKSALNMYANPYLAVDPTGYGSSYISFYNWISLGGNNYDFTSKYKIEFEGGTSERLKLQHVDFDNQLVLSKTGRVGIGEVSPAEKLQVNGNMLLEATHPVLKIKTTSAQASAEADIEFNGPSTNLAGIRYTNSSLVMSGRSGTFSDLVLKNGNVGIGTSSPTERLTLVGNMSMTWSNPTIQLSQGVNDKGFLQLSGDDLRLGTNSGNNLGNVIVRMNGADRFQFEESGRFTLLADNTPTMYFNTGGVNKAYLQLQGDNLRIRATGNKLYLGNDLTVDDATGMVGIGTTSPNTKLHVAGNAYIRDDIRINGRVLGNLSVQDSIITYGTGRFGDLSAYGGDAADGIFALGRDSYAGGVQSGAIGENAWVQGASNAFVIGTNVGTSASGSMVLADGGYLRNFTTFGGENHKMYMLFYNGYKLLTGIGTGVQMFNGDNSWSTISDSTKKENFLYTDGNSILQKIAGMRLGSWNYKIQDKQKRHYGPMAQEFHANFGNDGVGKIGNDTTIATADIDGVMMIAIQALIKEKEFLRSSYEKQVLEINGLKENEKKLHQRLEKIEAMLLKDPMIVTK